MNTNPYANGVALFTNDGGAARKFQHEVEVGMVGNTVPIPVPSRWPDPRHRGVDLGFPTNT